MPFIKDASRALAIRPSLLQAGVDDRTSSHTTPPVEDTRSSGNIVHACTAASYVSQATAAPQQDIAARNHDLMEVGALFDQK
ncbi:hypothetical protein BM1_04957 [Bipolaris maydis]|nr:hypothetical protein BM1_04957 [Bipolaris maydis]